MNVPRLNSWLKAMAKSNADTYLQAAKACESSFAVW